MEAPHGSTGGEFVYEMKTSQRQLRHMHGKGEMAGFPLFTARIMENLSTTFPVGSTTLS